MLLPFELTAKIDDAALAGELRIQALCSQYGCSSVSGPTSAIQFGGIAARMNPIIPAVGLVDGANIMISLYVAPEGNLAGGIHISEDWMSGPTFNLDILSQADGSWTGSYEEYDAPYWTLNAPRWDRVGDPVGVPEPPSGGLMALGMCLAVALGRPRLSMF